MKAGAARMGHNSPHLITSWILFQQEFLCPRLSPCIGGSFHPRAGVAGGTEPSIPPRPLGFSKSSSHGVSQQQLPRRGDEAQGCSASGMKNSESFGSVTGGIWRVVPFGQTVEGARKGTLHPEAELGWAKTSVIAGPKDFPIPKKKKKGFAQKHHSSKREMLSDISNRSRLPCTHLPVTSTLRMPQAPALQVQAPLSTEEGRWKEEDEGEPSGQAKWTRLQSELGSAPPGKSPSALSSSTAFPPMCYFGPGSCLSTPAGNN